MSRARRAALAIRVAAAAASFAVASCSMPTDMCGCPPSRSVVVATGTVLDAGGGPMAGARVAVDGVPPTMSADPPISFESATTADPAGRFTVRVYSGYAPAELALRAAVVPPGTADTVRLRTAVVARFVHDHERPDTVRLSIRLP